MVGWRLLMDRDVTLENSYADVDEHDLYASIKKAIVVRAIKDYRKALLKLKVEPENFNKKRHKAECERFFRSDWIMCLCDVDGELIMAKIKERAKWEDFHESRIC